jgi:hypothetical protein
MRTIFSLIILLLINLNIYAQIVDIYEINGPDNKIWLNENGIADINGSLELVINKKNLTQKIGARFESNTELITELEKFDEILLHQKNILSSLNQNLSQLALSERIQKLGQFSNLMSELYNNVKDDDEIREKFNNYIKEFNDLPEIEKEKYHNYYIEYGFDQLTSELKNNIDEIQSRIEQKKIRIQLTAYLSSNNENFKKVHIENFDDYKNGEFYEVDRWVTSFSEEDIEAFNRTNELANDLNNVIDKSFENIGSLIEDNIESYKYLNELLTDIKKTIKKKDKIFTSNLEVVELFLLEIQNELNTILEVVSKLEKYNGESENVLEHFNTTHDEFINAAKLFPLKVDKLLSDLPTVIKDSNQEILALATKINTCKTQLSEDLKKVQKVISITSNILKPFRNTAIKGDEIGNEVYKYSISELPDIGYIDLKYTGKRNNKDNLVIRVTIRSEDDLDTQKNGVVVEKHSLLLQQLKIYSVSNVSVILANPYNKSEKVALENNFQFAPSGSLLFKFGSRKCKTWNFLEPGIGFNVSTPDFDLDGVPEVGLGGVFTILQDVVSVGLSYNTKTDDPFWFFGLSLPFSTLGLPINTIKKDELK